jgi:hypothetical protein
LVELVGMQLHTGIHGVDSVAEHVHMLPTRLSLAAVVVVADTVEAEEEWDMVGVVVVEAL